MEPLLGEHSQLIVAPHQLRVHHRTGTGTGNPALGVDQCCGYASLDANSDPSFHFDADPHPDRDPTPSVKHVAKNQNKKFEFCSHQCHSTLFYLSCHRHTCHNFQYLGQCSVY